MSEEIFYCSTCRSSIAEEDLETGAAVILLGRRYCTRCKGAALRRTSIEDVAAEAAGVSHPATEKPQGRPTVKPASHARPALLPRRRHRPIPTLLLSAAGAAAVLAAAALLTRGGKTGGGRHQAENTPQAVAGKSPGPAAPHESPDAAARAYSTAEERLASTSSPEEVSRTVEAARPACRGTPWEARLDELRDRTIRRLEDAAAEMELLKIFGEIKAAVAGDPDFSRYAEVMEKAQRARALAARVAPGSIPDIQRAVSDYGERYEKMAEPFYEEIVETANGLAAERRYDDAIKKIETFPAKLRQSRAWKELETIKRRIEFDRKNDPSRKGS